MRIGAIAAILCLGVAGCTEVQIRDANGVSVHRDFGIVDINVLSSPGPSYVKASGVGVILSNEALNLGWADDRVATFPDPRACSIMVVSKTGASVRRIKEFLRLANGGRSRDHTLIKGGGNATHQ